MRQRKIAYCADCGKECSRRAVRCRSCREKYRWSDPDDPRRTARQYHLKPGDPGWPNCKCGCGQPAPPRKATNNVHGWVRGEPCAYILGHAPHTTKRDRLFETKVCQGSCGDFKLPTRFREVPTNPDGRDDVCRLCRRQEEIEQRIRSAPERGRAAAQIYRARKRDAFVEVILCSVVFERDQGICGICGKPVDPDRYDIDHIIPLSRNGEHSYANVRIAHPSCNYRKCNKLDSEMS